MTAFLVLREDKKDFLKEEMHSKYEVRNVKRISLTKNEEEIQHTEYFRFTDLLALNSKIIFVFQTNKITLQSSKSK